MNNLHKVPVFWLLPDPHFGHRTLVNKGIRSEGYEDVILNFIHKNVKDNDVIICLGDYVFGKANFWSEQFSCSSPCTKWITLGNHDHDTINWYLKHGFSAAASEIKLTIYSKVVLLSHIPVVNRNDFDINIHAHIHKGGYRQYRKNKKRINLFIENNLSLFNLRAVIDKYNSLGYYDCLKHHK